MGGSVDTASPFTVNSADAKIDFELAWLNDWSKYRRSDLELLVTMAVGRTLPLGATLNSPERFVINPEVLAALLGRRRPVPLPTGDWTLQVEGFEVNHPHRLGES